MTLEVSSPSTPVSGLGSDTVEQKTWQKPGAISNLNRSNLKGKLCIVWLSFRRVGGA